MKRLLLVAALAATSACRVEHAYVNGPAPTDFYSDLAPYGAWVDLPPYGAVWQPSPGAVGEDFYPYFTAGYWVNTEYGWSWNSEYPWGWVAFHHGRWVDAPSRGWVWVPGDEWAPAWVEWRVGAGNVGWVPLGPQGVTTVIAGYHPRWCFVPLGDFGRRDFHRARLPAYQEYAAYHASTAIPFERGDWRRSGPSVELVQRAGGRIEWARANPRRLQRGDVRAERRIAPGNLPPAPPARPDALPPSVQGRRAPPPPPGSAMPPMQQMPRAQHMPPPPGAPAPAAMSRPAARPPPASLPPPQQGRARRRPPGR
jgi:hypothetical protein